MAESVGQIGLDLVVNQQGFNKQMAGIQGLAKKAGVALAAAFAVKKFVDFGKQAIELGSDLNEVQNVVDVTFTAMSAKIDEFAKKAVTSFGLSETMAKRYTGTFGAMAKAFGFTESAAYDMSTTLTGLAGDVASFYNISQDEAYTKLKSVFTGETESLKDLGVVMTQAALDQFALANGFGKVTAKMSEAEKVALRYSFVTKQLSLASGDFARTSDGWANQVRILNLQFSSFKATIGQGLINLFTPIIKVINTLLGKLQTLANAFKSFTELITGNKSSSGSGIADTAGDLENAAGAASDLADNTTAVGKAAKDAAKQLGGIDKLNNISSTGSGTGTTAAGSAMGPSVDLGKLAEGDTVIDSTSSKFQGLIDKVKELESLFKQGFKIGLGDSDFSKVTTSIDSIRKSLAGIFTAPEVVTAADGWVNSIAGSLGKITGSVASIGTTAATLLVGSVSSYLEQNSEFIKGKIVSILDASSKAQEISGNLAVALAGIFTVFQSPEAIQIGSDLIAIFANSLLKVTDLVTTFGADLIGAIAQPILDNQDKIKEALENTLAPVETIVGGIKDFIDGAFQSIENSYNTYIAPALTLFSDGFNNVFSTLLDAYNTYVAPVLQNIADKFSALLTEHINPLITAFTDLAGEIVLAVAKIWDETLAPFMAWVIDNLAPPFSEALDKISGLFMDIAAAIADTITKALEKLGEFTTWIGDNQETIVSVTTVVGAFFAAWEAVKLMAFIQQSGGVVSALTALVAPLTTATTAIWANVTAFASATAAKIADKVQTVILTAMYAKDFVVSLASGTAALVKQAAQWVVNTAMKAADTVATIASTAATVAATAATWLFNTALAVLTSPITLVVAAIAGLIAVGVLLYKNWDEISAWASEAWDKIKATIKIAIDNVVGFFQKVIDFVKDNWQGLLLLIVNPFAGAFKLLYDNCDVFREFIDDFVKKIGEFFSGLWAGIQATFSNVGQWFKSKFTEAWKNIKDVFSPVGSFFSGIWNTIKSKFTTIGTNIGNAIGGAFKLVVNKVIGFAEDTINGFIRAINGAISLINKIPGVNIGKINLLDIPALATGGYVKANTPQLAMIGDNRHQGEVVAPEDKLQELLDKAVNASKGTDVTILVDLMRQIISLLTAILGKEYLAKITSGEVANALLYENEKSKNKTGRPLLT